MVVTELEVMVAVSVTFAPGLVGFGDTVRFVCVGVSATGVAVVKGVEGAVQPPRYTESASEKLRKWRR